MGERMSVRMGRLRAGLAGFRRAEDGSMIIFSLFLILVMLMIGGMAVDLMRFESTRSRLQSTLDRSILAAADLDQQLNAEGVVRDYFNKSGLLDDLNSVEVIETINSRSVRALASIDMDTYFMDLLGFDSLTAPAAGTAIESVSDIEIMLVLDVSGSMKTNSRLDNLQEAAVEFVESMFADDADGRISIGIVPFNGQINLGQTLRSQYAAFDNHGAANVNCVDLPPAAFATSDLSTSLPMPMTAIADTYSSTSTGNAYYQISGNGPLETNVWCPPSTGNIVQPPTRVENTLVNRINAFTAIGATSINAGMRWGIELIDPGSRPMFGSLISAGLVPVSFSNRPFAYNRDDTLKVIVLMSDGENFPEERVNNGYRTGTSPIWRGNTDGYLSIYHDWRINRSTATTLANSRPFWVPHLAQWHSRPWGGSSPANSMPYAEGTNRRFDTNNDGNCTNADDGRGSLQSSQACWTRSTQQNWQQVWAYVRMKWVAWQMYARPIGGSNSDLRSSTYNDQMEEFRTFTAASTMDTQLQAMCNMAQGRGVTVFTIAFEAPPNGEDQLYDCASSPSHYFDANGLEISSAFRAIAAQINRLRLIE